MSGENEKRLAEPSGSDVDQKPWDKALAAIAVRAGAEPPRGPNALPGGPNHTAISILKQEIERTQATLSFAVAHVRHVEQSLTDARNIRSCLAGQEKKQVETLCMIAKAEGLDVQALMHEMNQDCDADDCETCCGEYRGHEFDSSEGGHCICGANGYESGEI